MSEPVFCMPDEQRDELRAKHGSKIAFVETTAHGTAAFRKPTRGEIKYAMNQGLMDPTREKWLDAIDPLSRQCVIYPEKKLFSDWIDETPLMPLECYAALTNLAIGARSESDSK